MHCIYTIFTVKLYFCLKVLETTFIVPNDLIGGVHMNESQH